MVENHKLVAENSGLRCVSETGVMHAQVMCITNKVIHKTSSLDFAPFF